jgi:NTP pyrophosphatase (non-canonical NTP hydrolase)
MPKKAGAKTTGPNSAQILLFPTGDAASVLEADRCSSPLVGVSTPIPRRVPSECHVVLSGSFRRDVEGLRRIHEEFTDHGCVVLSPKRVEPAQEVDGFVYMKGEETETPQHIELKHLEAIQNATFVWLHAPEGYVGLSAALEVGFAHSQGIPVFCQTQVSELVLQSFVSHVDSVSQVVDLVATKSIPPPKLNLRAFQRYYKRVASQRGYERETAQNCLLLMVEEVGELAHALRKRAKLARSGNARAVNEAQELADVLLYVIHMANILDLDIGSAVLDKEQMNIAKFVRSR